VPVFPEGDKMTHSEPYASKERDDAEATNPASPATDSDDAGRRAADLSADRYAELEHEHRSSRFDRAVTRAREA
jgi:hypothetical protein